jgi:hypothetical protein
MSVNFKDTISSINNVMIEYELLKKEISNKIKNNLEGVFKSFFETYPEVKTIHWLQYTPHFNDGDECVFSVHELNFTASEQGEIEDVWGEEDELSFSRYSSAEGRKLEGQMLEDAVELELLIAGEIGEVVLRDAFGDGYWVKAHRGGFEVVEHYHD